MPHKALSTRSPFVAWVLLLTLVLLTPSSSDASGMRTHMTISLYAVDLLPDGPLKTFLKDTTNFNALINGSYFPDTGYAAKDGYGEIAHWEPFVAAYIAKLRADATDPTKGTTAPYLAFLLGAASHSMADQVFDAFFMKKSAEQNDTTADFDMNVDILMLAEQEKKAAIPDEFVPKEWISQIMTNTLKHKLEVATIEKGVNLARLAMKALDLLAPTKIEDIRTKLPWATKHYMRSQEAGSLTYTAYVVSRYWLYLWQRAQGKDDLAQIVLRTRPQDQGSVSIQHKSVDSFLGVFFGDSLDATTLTTAQVTVKSDDGQSAPLSLRRFGGVGYNTTRTNGGVSTLIIRPAEDWKENTDYTLTLSTAVKDLNGKAIPQAFSFRFTTKPPPPEPEPTDANEASPDTNSTPETSPKPPANTDPNAPTNTACGCQQTSQNSTPLLLFLLTFLLSLRFTRPTSPTHPNNP